jgi:hypothetical protein
MKPQIPTGKVQAPFPEPKKRFIDETFFKGFLINQIPAPGVVYSDDMVHKQKRS